MRAPQQAAGACPGGLIVIPDHRPRLDGGDSAPGPLDHPLTRGGQVIDQLGSLEGQRLVVDHVDIGQIARRRWEGPDVPDRTTMAAAHLFVGGLSELVIAWLDGKLDSSLDELIDDTAALMDLLIESAADRAQARADK